MIRNIDTYCTIILAIMEYPLPNDARDVINEAFPSIGAKVCTQLGEGWGSYVFDVDGAFIFKFPRNDSVFKGMTVEKNLLFELKQFLSVSLPFHEYVSNGGKNPFMGYRKLPGVNITELPLNEGHAISISKVLARIYGEMRAFPVEIASERGVSVREGKDWKNTIERLFDEIRMHAFPSLGKKEMRAVQELFDNFLKDSLNFEFDARLIHGDLTTDHVLFNFGFSDILGIVGWDDALIADPAMDFAWLHDVLPENLLLRTIIDSGYKEPSGMLKRSQFYHQIVPLREIVHHNKEGNRKAAKASIKRFSSLL